MPTSSPASELLPEPAVGRVHRAHRLVRLGDVDSSGRIRLDATARFLQDIATDDAADAALDRKYGWLVRRTKVVVKRPATLGERVAVSTWCTGIGRSWAERRTSIVGERDTSIETVSLWVQVDVETGRPARVADDFTDAYEAVSGGRKVSARLALPPLGGSAVPTPWTIRRSDLDPFDHVNNAATWAFVEEFAELGDRVGIVELEYLLPIRHGGATEVFTDTDGSSDTTDLWLAVDGSVHAAARWVPSTT